jgi:uncharacterized MAPEG superfamily protein
MTTDLWMLVAAAGFQWALILGVATPMILSNGMPWAAGNRETPSKALPTWHARLTRADQNMRENLVLFAVLVLVAHVSGEADSTSALGAQVFVAARVAHAVVYVAGVAWLRTVLWGVSIAGLGMIVSTLT